MRFSEEKEGKESRIHLGKEWKRTAKVMYRDLREDIHWGKDVDESKKKQVLKARQKKRNNKRGKRGGK